MNVKTLKIVEINKKGKYAFLSHNIVYTGKYIEHKGFNETYNI